MKIIVFVKQVPDTEDVKLDPKTGNLQREGVQSIMNPLDANAWRRRCVSRKSTAAR